MRQRGVIAALAAAAFLAAGCSMTAGSGPLRSETRQVSGFTTVRLTGTGDVRIAQGGADSLTVQAQDNLLPLLTSEVSDGTLTLGTKENTTITTAEPITYTVTVKELSGLEISGSGTETAKGVSTPSLRVAISGSGTITVDGSADRQDVELSGSGDYRAASLNSTAAQVTISGSGAADVAVSGSLDVTISGSGSLTYSGYPTVSQDVTGSGSVEKR